MGRMEEELVVVDQETKLEIRITLAVVVVAIIIMETA